MQLGRNSQSFDTAERSRTSSEEITFPHLAYDYDRLPFLTEKDDVKWRLHALKEHILSQPSLIYYSILSPIMTPLYSLGGFLATDQGRMYLKSSVKGLFSMKRLRKDPEVDRELREWMRQNLIIKPTKDGGYTFYLRYVENGDPKRREKTGRFSKAYPVLELRPSLLGESEKAESHWTVITDYREEASELVKDLAKVAPADWSQILSDIDVALERQNFLGREEYSNRVKQWEEQEKEKLFEFLGPNLDYKAVTHSVERIGERSNLDMERQMARELVARLRQDGRKKEAKALKKELRRVGALPPFNYRPFIVAGFGLGAWFSLDLINSAIFGVVPGPVNLVKAIQYAAGTGLDWNRSVDLALHTDTWNFWGESSNVIDIYRQLDGNKDPNVYSLVRFFLGDGRLSPEEIGAVPYFTMIRDEVVPKNLLSYWPIEERGAVACRAMTQILKDGVISPDEQTLLAYIPKSKRPMTVWNETNSGVFANPHMDKDKDGFDAMAEFLHDRSDANPLETPLTDPSEVYIVSVNGSGGGWMNPGLEINLILRYYAIKYGIPEDHIRTFAKYVITGERWYGDSLSRISPDREHFFREIKGHLLNDNPLKIDYLDDNCNKANLIKEINRVLQLTDNNDILYIHNSSEMPGFKLFHAPYGSSDYEIILPPEMNGILAAPHHGKVILVSDACEAEYYIEGLLHSTYGPTEMLKDFVGIGAVRKGELSGGTFEFTFINRLRNGYSIRGAVPSELYDPFDIQRPETIVHPVVYTGEGDYSWLENSNLFGVLTVTNLSATDL